VRSERVAEIRRGRERREVTRADGDERLFEQERLEAEGAADGHDEVGVVQDVLPRALDASKIDERDVRVLSFEERAGIGIDDVAQPVRGGVLGHDQRDVLGEALDHVQEELALAPKGSIGVEARLACELEREKADAPKAGTERALELAERAHRREVRTEAPAKAREERSLVRRELAIAEGSCAVRGNGAIPEAARI